MSNCHQWTDPSTPCLTYTDPSTDCIATKQIGSRPYRPADHESRRQRSSILQLWPRQKRMNRTIKAATTARSASRGSSRDRFGCDGRPVIGSLPGVEILKDWGRKTDPDLSRSAENGLRSCT